MTPLAAMVQAKRTAIAGEGGSRGSTGFGDDGFHATVFVVPSLKLRLIGAAGVSVGGSTVIGDVGGNALIFEGDCQDSPGWSIVHLVHSVWTITAGRLPRQGGFSFGCCWCPFGLRAEAGAPRVYTMHRGGWYAVLSRASSHGVLFGLAFGEYEMGVLPWWAWAQAAEQ